MDRDEKIRFAKAQFAESWRCDPAAFDAKHNVFVEAKDTFFEIITFGEHAVIRAEERMLRWCRERFAQTPARWILDGDNLFLLETKLRSYRKKLGGEHMGYLRLKPGKAARKPESFSYAWHKDEEIAAYYAHREFENAMTFGWRGQHDRLAITARLGDKPVAMAGCDDYMDTMWQIGIDVLPAYKGRGLGAYLVRELALEIERQGKLPYYNTWSANIASTRLALSVGFTPVWLSYPSEDV